MGKYNFNSFLYFQNTPNWAQRSSDIIYNKTDMLPPPGRAACQGVGSISANSDAQNVLSFRSWRFEMKLTPFFSSK